MDAELPASALDLAVRAGRVALRWFSAQSLDSRTKADGSPVTDADRAAEEFLRGELARRYPADGVVGEEYGTTEGTSGRRWVIDPIDGTRTFVRGVPLFATLLALIDETGPAVGVANIPALDETVTAGRGRGAHHHCAGEVRPARVSERRRLDGAYLVTSGAEYLPERARRLRRATLQKVLRECRIRKRTVEEVYALFHQAALVVAPGVTEGAVETIQLLLAQLQLVNEQVRTMDRGITALLEELPAALGEAGAEAEEADSLTRLLSMKGAGTVVAAGLFGEASDLLVGGSFQQTRAYLGAAPVTKKSGQTERIYKRRAVNRHGQNALYHFAAAAIAADPGVQRQKEVLKARGHNHARILRTLGDRLLRIFFAMQRDKTLYDPERTLRKTAA